MPSSMSSSVGHLQQSIHPPRKIQQRSRSHRKHSPLALPFRPRLEAQSMNPGPCSSPAIRTALQSPAAQNSKQLQQPKRGGGARSTRAAAVPRATDLAATDTAASPEEIRRPGHSRPNRQGSAPASEETRRRRRKQPEAHLRRGRGGGADRPGPARRGDARGMGAVAGVHGDSTRREAGRGMGEGGGGRARFPWLSCPFLPPPSLSGFLSCRPLAATRCGAVRMGCAVRWVGEQGGERGGGEGRCVTNILCVRVFFFFFALWFGACANE